MFTGRNMRPSRKGWLIWASQPVGCRVSHTATKASSYARDFPDRHLAPTKGSSPNGTGYDIYDIWDLGEFDQKGARATKWGTKKDLLSAIKAAADKGIITYIDAVMNHKCVRTLSMRSPGRAGVVADAERAGADDKEEFMATMVDQSNRNKRVGDMHNIEGWTK